MDEQPTPSVPPLAVRARDDDTTQIVTISRREAVRPAKDRCLLVMLVGNMPGSLMHVLPDGLVLGRGKCVQGRIPDPGLSRKHARVFRRGGQWYAEDLGSTNGTYVAGERLLAGPRLLSDGDRIQLGQNTLYKVSFTDAIEHAAHQQMYESAVTDPLTGVFNRRHLDERLEGEFAFSARHGSVLSILLFDVDHFKRINDGYGHQAGDAVLRVMAQTVKRMVRTEDVVARYGGEEFAVIARGIDRRNAAILGERIRRLVQGLAIPWESRSIHVTVSVGVATLDHQRPYDSVSDLLGSADRSLYRAKEEGRNRVVTL